MKESPILFNGAMVRAILNSSKTQTRRVVKPCKDPDFGCELSPGDIAGDEHAARLCPYGQPGDRLWLREAWRAPLAFELTPPRDIPPGTPIVYQADGAGSLPHFNAGKLRPSMFMPRWASRIALEITAVRVERLQEISEADAKAEGIHKPIGSQFWHTDPGANILPGETPTWAYRNLWESINGPGSWAANPWLWVVTFERVQP